MLRFAEVIVSVEHESVDKIFHYSIPNELLETLKIGMRVSVPFGNRNKISGYVIGFSKTTDIPLDKIKNIISITDEYPVFDEKMIEVAKWMKEKYYTTLSRCLKTILPSGIDMKILESKFVKINYELENIEEIISDILKKSDKQKLLLEFLIKNNDRNLDKKAITSILKISSSPIDTLIKKEILVYKSAQLFRNSIKENNNELNKPFKLNQEQEEVFKNIVSRLDEKENKITLIHGVTGSGKTEIYLQVIAEVLKLGKQAIMLVPEISLTPQTVNHFVGRFGDKVSVTHSRLSNGERFDQWRRAREGHISVMIGPRSAIFTPFLKLGVIILDEEHESTYKSETSPKYSTKEVAEKLMELCKCSVILGSATPSVETFFQTTKGEIELLTLKKRVNNKPPDIEVIDMREELANGNRSIFGEKLMLAINENLTNGQQTILFINRRGHSTFVSCRVCGNVLTCSKCSINFTYHIFSNKLSCHYCGEEEENPRNCPVCGSAHIKYFGVGTQKVEEEIAKFFPTARVLRMDMDTTSKKHSHERILSDFSNKKADILLGTQMIAKGHDFPNVSLVGIIAADLSLNNGDFRSAETTYQLISQVSGRAGRGAINGKVFIQTYNPDHYSIVFSQQGDYNKFYEHEITVRQTMLYPPFTNIFNIMFIGEDEKKIIQAFNKLAEIMNYYNKNELFEILGPSPAQISKINKNYRWKLFVKCVDEDKIKQYTFFCLKKLSNNFDLSNITINTTLNPFVLS